MSLLILYYRQKLTIKCAHIIFVFRTFPELYKYKDEFPNLSFCNHITQRIIWTKKQSFIAGYHRPGTDKTLPARLETLYSNNRSYFEFYVCVQIIKK